MLNKATDTILFVIPPITLLESPSLGAHSVQKVAQNEGYQIKILYADQLFAKYIGIDLYKAISNELMSPYEQIPERLFAKTAHQEIPYMGKNTNKYGIIYESHRSDNNFKNTPWSSLIKLEPIIDEWLSDVACKILDYSPKIVGLATSHQQTNASISIINKIKSMSPETITVVGGSNCDGDMSIGIESLSNNVDYIFTGESELSFLGFLQNYEKGVLPSTKIIHEKKVTCLNDLPLVDYSEYYQQLSENGLTSSNTWITYESSRGCWWGQRNLCTFCGVNGNEPKYRAKNHTKVLDEISTHLGAYPSNNIRMVDALMPRNYLRNLIPNIANTLPDVSIFYEQKADMSYEELKVLKNAGVDYMQIGIESFSNEQLVTLKKGTTVKDNINILRYARMLNVVIGWNMLTEIPGDTHEQWLDIYSILPAIRHLYPPVFFRPIEITRFSPYFLFPDNYRISNIKPFRVYSDIFPSEAEVDNLAWLFSGDYECDSRINKSLQTLINEEVDYWIQRWSEDDDSIPHLELHKYGVNKYMIRDTRLIYARKELYFIDKEQASTILLGRCSPSFELNKEWAIKNNLLIEVDGELLPIVTYQDYIMDDFNYG